ncbi:MAG: hydroxymethylbilane synthase [Pseudomonadota bacterium]
MNIRIGTRGSALALWQAEWVKGRLLDSRPDLDIELVLIKTSGDKILDVPLAMVGGKGLFVKEIEEALLDQKIDLAVHSMKDMPVTLPDDLMIGALPKRETPWDVLVSRNNLLFKDIPKGSRIGTSSLRRSAQIRHIRPDIEIVPLRGNLDTRLRKLKTEELDAIVLAAAGIERLGWKDQITEYLKPELMLPAIAQGAIGVEIRRSDTFVRELVAKLNHPETETIVSGERAFLRRLEGGCQIPIAALGNIFGDSFELTGLVAEVDGSNIIRQSISGPAGQSESLGIELAEQLLEAGADKILSKLLGASTL